MTPLTIDYLFHAEQLEQWEESDARINYPESWQRKTIVNTQNTQKFIFNIEKHERPERVLFQRLGAYCVIPWHYALPLYF